jgi:hypothetical protein
MNSIYKATMPKSRLRSALGRLDVASSDMERALAAIVERASVTDANAHSHEKGQACPTKGRDGACDTKSEHRGAEAS